MSGCIKILDAHTANQIAAGEVVDRPCSVIKELIENALDAQSSAIEIEIRQGGIEYMRVTDNGVGMTEDDARLAVKRHATSKLRQAGDLLALSTLGFRGEALPTIASVSKFSLLTRRRDSELATLVEITGGVDMTVREAGGSVGTAVVVENLFFNTPARQKFLKSASSEASHINEIIIKQAIANPQVAFRFINNQKLVLTTPGGGELADTLVSIYGGKVAGQLMAINYNLAEDVAISGYVSKPTVIRSSRQWQTLIVNGRIINSRALSKAIDTAYHSLLPKSGYPLAALNIKVPLSSVDVNVHPQKSEVKFADEGKLYRAVYKAIGDAIRAPQDALATVTPADDAIKVKYVQSEFNLPPGAAYVNTVEPSPRLAESSVDFFTARQLLNPAETMKPPPAEPAKAVFYENNLAPMGQVAKCYIIASDAMGLYLIDQHAAHERILYDRFAKIAADSPAQQLLVHVFIEFNEREYNLIQSSIGEFAALGFKMEPSGPWTMRLMEIPMDIAMEDAENTVRQIVAGLFEYHAPTAREIRHLCLATMACRAAIKAGDVLNNRQMQIILDELLNADLPYTCPHGRPTIIQFDEAKLAKLFKRT